MKKKMKSMQWEMEHQVKLLQHIMQLNNSKNNSNNKLKNLHSKVMQVKNQWVSNKKQQLGLMMKMKMVMIKKYQELIILVIMLIFR